MKGEHQHGRSVGQDNATSSHVAQKLGGKIFIENTYKKGALLVRRERRRGLERV